MTFSCAVNNTAVCGCAHVQQRRLLTEKKNELTTSNYVPDSGLDMKYFYIIKRWHGRTRPYNFYEYHKCVLLMLVVNRERGDSLANVNFCLLINHTEFMVTNQASIRQTNPC